MSHVTHMHESCHWIIRVTWLIRMMYIVCVSMSHVTYMRESCHRIDSHTWHDSSKWFRCRLSHVTHERRSRYTYARVMSHLFINHVTRMNKDDCVTSIFFLLACLISCHAKKRQPWLIYHVIDLNNLWYTCLMNESCHAWVMSRTCVGHVTWPCLIHTSDVTHFSLISFVST